LVANIFEISFIFGFDFIYFSGFDLCFKSIKADWILSVLLFLSG